VTKAPNRQDRRRARSDPDHYYWAGRELLTKADWQGAAAAFLQATRLAPSHAAFHRAHGLAVVRLDQYDAAIQSFKRAVNLDPTMARAWSDLGVTMLKAGMAAEGAIPCLERALAIEPELEQARMTLAVALANEGKTDLALAVLDHAVEDVPNADIQYARGSAKLRQARIAEAIATLRGAIKLDPEHMMSYHNLLFTLQHSVGIMPETLFAEHRVWAEAQARLAPADPRPSGGAPDPDRRPVIGLSSGDLRCHALGYLTIRAIEGLARRGYRIVAFANQSETDQIGERFKKATARWHRVDLISDQDMAALIRREKIDIMIDLAGHTGRHRLGVFALKPAPIQGTWAGYVGTTGLDTMDFLIADPIEVPAGEDQWYTEKIVRMPECYVTYEPPSADRALVPPPSLTRGYVTFGCFNRPAKLNADVFLLWSRILQRVPSSRLLLKYAGVDTGITHDMMVGMARAAGIAADRISYEPGEAAEAMQAAYEQVDVALDSFPYSGGITTLEASWMGVPVVTFRGKTFAGRHSASHLTALGLSQLVGETPDDYVELAVDLAQDPMRLTTLRAGMRDRMLASPLYDGDRFAAGMDTAFRQLWRDYCERRRAEKS
jgi:predicted O-linked N-acetylglucosamine transferase (SPINDLY family)